MGGISLFDLEQRKTRSFVQRPCTSDSQKGRLMVKRRHGASELPALSSTRVARAMSVGFFQVLFWDFRRCMGSEAHNEDNSDDDRVTDSQTCAKRVHVQPRGLKVLHFN